MSLNTMIRQSHRWLSIVFTLTVSANFIMLFAGQQNDVITYLPLLPLFLLLFSGLYMFFRPYFRRHRPS